jgi:ribosomal protein S18 acetylase RimI-like enzyme
MSNRLVEQAQVRDWRRTRSVRLRALRDTPDAFGSTLDREVTFADQVWKQRLTRTDAATFLARLERLDVGIVIAAAEDGGDAGLYSLWVAPGARGRGVGDALVSAAVDWASRGGCNRIRLDVADFNTPAIRLYARHGFLPTGETGTLPAPRTHVTEHTRALELAGRHGTDCRQ